MVRDVRLSTLLAWTVVLSTASIHAHVVAARPANKYYVVNREPLRQTAFVHLPAGAVKARGWLRDQLRVEADGLTSASSRVGIGVGHFW